MFVSGKRFIVTKCYSPLGANDSAEISRPALARSFMRFRAGNRMLARLGESP
jgi:hypothetical protein